MVDELLAEGGIGLSALDAIAFGRGPGGFTGVRLAASVAQGLAFGAGLPVVPVSDLMAVAQRALAANRVIVCNDARMREVYWACFEQIDGLAAPVGEERVSPPDSVAIPAGWRSPVLAAGRGFAAYPQLRSRLEPHLAAIHDRMLPRAHEIALLAAPMLQKGGGLPPEQAAPVYLRDEVAQPAER